MLKLILASLISRAGNTALSLILIAGGVMLATMVLLFTQHLQKRLSTDANGIDMVIGAKGSPLQLVLSTVYHADIPTGNISPAESQQWITNPQVKTAIPLALGDNWHGHRIIGTTHDYPAHYNANLADGTLWNADFEAIVGARVPLNVGDTFTGAHGLIPTHHGHHHHDHDDHDHHDDDHAQPYTVTGKLNPTGTVIDRLILTSTHSVQALHDDSTDITAYITTLKTPYAHLGLIQNINRNAPVLAAHPATEMARLSSTLGMGTTGLKALSAIIIIIAALTIFAGINASFESRKSDIAILRALGFTRFYTSAMLAIEGGILSAAGCILGVLSGYIAYGVMAKNITVMAASGAGISAPTPTIYALILTCTALGLLCGIIPALRASRLDAADQLAKDA